MKNGLPDKIQDSLQILASEYATAERNARQLAKSIREGK